MLEAGPITVNVYLLFSTCLIQMDNLKKTAFNSIRATFFA